MATEEEKNCILICVHWMCNRVGFYSKCGDCCARPNGVSGIRPGVLCPRTLPNAGAGVPIESPVPNAVSGVSVALCSASR